MPARSCGGGSFVPATATPGPCPSRSMTPPCGILAPGNGSGPRLKTEKKHGPAANLPRNRVIECPEGGTRANHSDRPAETLRITRSMSRCRMVHTRRAPQWSSTRMMTSMGSGAGHTVAEAHARPGKTARAAPILVFGVVDPCGPCFDSSAVRRPNCAPRTPVSQIQSMLTDRSGSSP